QITGDNAGANNIFLGFDPDGAGPIPVQGHTFTSGDRIIYRRTPGGADIGVTPTAGHPENHLVDGRAYYVIKTGNFTIQLAEDLNHAVGNPDPDGDPGTNDAIPVTPLALIPNKSNVDPEGAGGPLPAPTNVRH